MKKSMRKGKKKTEGIQDFREELFYLKKLDSDKK